MVEKLSPSEFRQLLATSPLHACIDVRERGEFALGPIPWATPLPRGTIEYRVQAMIPDQRVPVAVYCDDGRRSDLAAATLGAMGYTKVAILDGGLQAWRQQGLPTIEGWGVGGKLYAEQLAIRDDVPQITADELAALRTAGEPLLVVDVRTDEEFERGHVPDAYHVPGGQLLLEIESIPGSRNSTIVVSCAGRTRGILGAHTLRRAGWTNVCALLNGAMGWRLAGYDLESGAGHGHAPS